MLEAEGKIYSTPDMQANYQDPGVGSTQIVTYRYSNGYLVEQDQESGIYSSIKDYAMIIIGAVVDKVSGVVISVADMLVEQIDTNKYVTAKTYTSHSYFGKEGQVWASTKTWQTWFDSRSRDSFKHYYSSFVGTDGYTHTGQKDYIPPNGYGPTLTEYSPHYFDNSWIMNKAWENWYKNEQSYANKIEYWYQ
jgi:hypothetical protein